jgi:hypothetical protein
MSHLEVAKIFGRALDREVRAQVEAIDDWRLRAKGLDKYALDNLVSMFEYYDRWGLVGNPKVLSWLLKREPTSLEMFVKKVA